MNPLRVTFGQHTLAEGETITKAMAQEPLKFYWPKERGHSYSVQMVDLDAPTYRHYLADQISLGSDGRLIYAYRPPNPPAGTHHYQVTVYDDTTTKVAYSANFYVVA